MAQEMALVATAVISSMAALGGVALTWALGNITSESKDRRLEREAVRNRLEDKYVQILTDIDFYLRWHKGVDQINDRLSQIGATVSIFAGKAVIEKYEELSAAIRVLEMLQKDGENSALYKLAPNNKAEWEAVCTAMTALAEAMQAETRLLRNF